MTHECHTSQDPDNGRQYCVTCRREWIPRDDAWKHDYFDDRPIEVIDQKDVIDD